ncbi:MAG: CHAT domain-containing protein [Acidobacteria bacterium]|nr:CHAT domain-containing protein [Acidobacteriota bacterium]
MIQKQTSVRLVQVIFFFTCFQLNVFLAAGQTPGASQAQSSETLEKARKFRQNNNLADLHASLACYETAIADARQSHNSTNLGRLYFEAGQVYFQCGKVDSALERLGLALEQYQAVNDKTTQARILNYLGSIHIFRGEFQPGIENFNQGLKLCRELNETVGIAYVLVNLATAHQGVGNYQVAIDCLAEALMIRKQVGDLRGQAIVLYSLGTLRLEQDETAIAIEYFSQALDLHRADLKDPGGKAIVLTGLSTAFWKAERYEASLKYAEEALAIFQQIGDQKGKIQLLITMGSVALKYGEYQKAFNLANQALELAEQTSDVQSLMYLYQLLGNYYVSVADLEKSIQYYQDSLRYAQKLNNVVQQGILMSSIGSVYFRQQQYPAAQRAHQQAVELLRKTGNRLNLGQTLQNLGAALHQQGRLDEALVALDEARSLLQAIEYNSGLSGVYVEIGQVKLAAHKSDEAYAAFQAALHIARKANDNYLEAHVCFCLAKLERSRQNFDEAVHLIEEAIAKAEYARGNINDPFQRATFFSQVQEFFDVYLLILIDQYHQHPSPAVLVKAFQVHEQGHSRSLLDSLSNQKGSDRLADSSLLGQDINLRNQIAFKCARLTELLNQTHTADQERQLKSELEELLTRHQQLKEDLRQSRDVKTAAIAPVPLDLKDLQARLDSETVLVKYAMTREKTFVWVVDRESFRMVELADRATLTPLIERVHLAYSQSDQSRNLTKLNQKSVLESQSPVWNLSRQLLDPIRPFLRQKLLIIPADSMFSIPFGILPVSDATNPNQTHYFIELQEISILPSTSLMKYFKPTPLNADSIEHIAVFADPVFSLNDTRMKAISRNINQKHGSSQRTLILGRDDSTKPIQTTEPLTINRLPWTEKEAQRIQRFARNRKVLVKSGADATLSALQALDLEELQILHFATHGLVDQNHPDLSALILSLVDKDGNSMDGFLRGADIVNLRLKTELVVLSACHTGTGKEIPGEGILSLTRNFLMAGSQRVVYTLWAVNDQATTHLMERFYFHLLKEKRTPADALRKAQLDMLRTERWKDPYYWAAFQIQGAMN